MEHVETSVSGRVDAALMRGVAAAPRSAAATPRQGFVDVFRGLLIAHMALDHASLMFNAGRPGEELAAAAAPHHADLLQFLTRFTGVPVAPAFFFMAGFMAALTSACRAERGVAHREITQRLIVRGLMLIAVDAVIMGLPRAAMGFYSFAVLSSIGVGIVVLALVRDAPSRVLLPVAVAVLVLHPLIDVSGWPVALRAVFYEPVRSGAFRSLYPVIPWCAIVVVGFVVGRDSMRRTRSERLWMRIGGGCLVLFFALRLNGGYGNAYAYGSVLSLDFWSFAKYPPDLPFLAWSFAITFVTLALLSVATRAGTPLLLRPLAVFGRVPFFFYVVHFYVLGTAAALVGTKLSLPHTYVVWLALLAIMTWPCVWYFEKKQQRPNWLTRHF